MNDPGQESRGGRGGVAGRRVPEEGSEETGPRQGEAPGDLTLVVVPTYNERENLPRVVAMVLDVLEPLHVLVVDDGSPDGTGELADELARRGGGRVHVLHRESKRGLGQAYLAGFRWGLDRGYARICEMDADLSHPPDRLPAMVEAASTVDFVIGSRYVDGRVRVVNWPMSRLLLSYFGSRYARVVTGLPVSDATGGFNLFRREVLEALDLERIESEGYSFQIELKLRAWRRGFRFQELPIVFTERDQGESKMSRRIVAEAVWKVWKLRALHLLGRL
jgi:dolichol-phosphate mannosyltransferase